MTAPHASQIIDGYLARLDAELAGVPATRRRELLDDVRTHVSEARAGLTEETDADLLNIVERLGDPAALAAEARARLEAARAVPFRPNAFQAVALLAIALFGFIGIPLLWLSRGWALVDRAIVSLLVTGFCVGAIVGAIVGLPFGLRHWFLGLILPVQVLSATYLAFRLTRRAPQPD